MSRKTLSKHGQEIERALKTAVKSAQTDHLRAGRTPVLREETKDDRPGNVKPVSSVK